MGQASASASSSSGINASGNSLSINKPNWIAWLVIAFGLVLAYKFLKGKNGRL
jgi:hypothetical protein